MDKNPVCLAASCSFKVKARNLCDLHYQQVMKNGGFKEQPKRSHCLECGNKIYARELCAAHYMSIYRKGLVPKTIRSPFEARNPLPFQLKDLNPDAVPVIRKVIPRGNRKPIEHTTEDMWDFIKKELNIA